MSKYDPLARWLRNQSGFEVSVRLTEIEAIIAALLPDSAWMLTAWWANDARPVQSRAWVREGWRAYPRLVSGKIGTVIFKRDKREESVAEPLHGFRILLVEDNDDNRFALTALLEVMGASVWAVGDAETALRLLGEIPVDVVLSDIQMPGHDGFWLIRELRSREEYRALPAVAVTARVDPLERRLILAAGYQGHVPKPADIDDLAATIRAAVAAAPNHTNS